ncbi:hypothetical protein WOSG25_051500 [Weissella oryzae SG25]|uniref:Uncharacterized protein n=1 Tax=Weissella oryzae (strain DSM 25784 / JCM 18191 / LMG 30913 / SG25) TaxID=1329250 RepID=A0A069CU16_WEIOS|nr:hypothetical protein [Weissella oryzae]GAK30877.1 hypothetical protein WOSG25_051500 [Weissella oryzae SG25]
MSKFKFFSFNIFAGALIIVIPILLFSHPGPKAEGFHFENNKMIKLVPTQNKSYFINSISKSVSDEITNLIY